MNNFVMLNYSAALPFCENKLDDCSVNAACSDNEDGSYTCTCNDGYIDTFSEKPGRVCYKGIYYTTNELDPVKW